MFYGGASMPSVDNEREVARGICDMEEEAGKGSIMS